ncbi:endonuclease [Kocuria sp. cx-116]|uniref:endonuclease n=1 Tax=Kocuria sp. cx-116 TaxID=2771378 RepID=UPI001682AE55|nr:endonuclease [Kocuria sp. cx-116]MBD2762491.1 endonuclease [Kocuria sp. cx-116]
MSQRDIIDELLDEHGRTYAREAGINLEDTPASLFQLLVLANLLSTRINAGIAVATARELTNSGFSTPEKMRDATWQQRVDALGRGGYRRYDERTSTMLGDCAVLLLDRYTGDLRRLRDESQDSQEILKRLQEFPGIGPTGAAIFAREVQGLWPVMAPFFDKKALDGARKLNLPDNPDALAGLVSREDLPRLASALVRVTLDRSAK